jgi:hypothetical protein
VIVTLFVWLLNRNKLICFNGLGVELRTIQAYLDAFKYGTPPHAGGGIGMFETGLKLYNIDNQVWSASLCCISTSRISDAPLYFLVILNVWNLDQFFIIVQSKNKSGR